MTVFFRLEVAEDQSDDGEDFSVNDESETEGVPSKFHVVFPWESSLSVVGFDGLDSLNGGPIARSPEVAAFSSKDGVCLGSGVVDLVAEETSEPVIMLAFRTCEGRQL